MKKVSIIVGIIVIIIVAVLIVFTQSKNTFVESNDPWCNELPKAAKEFFTSTDNTVREQELQIIDGMIAEQLKQPEFKKYNITRNELCAHQLAFMEVLKKPPVSTNGGKSYSFGKVQAADLTKYIGEDRAIKVLEAKNLTKS